MTFVRSMATAATGAPAQFAEQVTPPATVANTASIYTKDVVGISEFFVLDDAGNEVQVTNGGRINAGGTLPNGTDASGIGNTAGAGPSYSEIGGNNGSATAGASTATPAISQWSAGVGSSTDTGQGGDGNTTNLGGSNPGGDTSDPVGTGGTGGLTSLRGGNGGNATGGGFGGVGGTGDLDSGLPGTGGSGDGSKGGVTVGIANAGWILSGNTTGWRHRGGLILQTLEPTGSGTVTRSADLKQASHWLMTCFGADTLNLTYARGSGANFGEGQSGKFRIKQNPAGDATVTWTYDFGAVRWPGGVPQALTLGVGAEDIFEFMTGSFDIYIWRIGAAFA